MCVVSHVAAIVLLKKKTYAPLLCESEDGDALLVQALPGQSKQLFVRDSPHSLAVSERCFPRTFPE